MNEESRPAPDDSSPASDSRRQGRIDDVIVQYLESSSASSKDRRQQLVEQNPDLADELNDFFQLHDRLQGAVDIPDKTDGDITQTSFKRRAFQRQPKHQELIGQSFGDYQIQELIARGGMGVVYKARQVSLNRRVALKMILAGEIADNEEVQRFRSEAEAAAKLEHPFIVPIYEVGCIDHCHYISMSFIDGPSLADRIAQGPLPPYQATELIQKISQAVAYAHDRQIIHRDLKPANILLARKHDQAESAMVANDSQRQLEKTFYEKSEFVPRITDFGLAKHTDDHSDLTATGQILGTPNYMSPEQAAGKVAETSQASDIYSIGAILYAALTGKPPLEQDNYLDLILDVIGKEPRQIREINKKIPKPLAIICHKCLEKEPRNRYTSASELADDLGRVLNKEPIVARQASLASRTWRWSRQRPALAVTLISLLVFFCIFLIDSFYLQPKTAIKNNALDQVYTIYQIADVTSGVLMLVSAWLGAAGVFSMLATVPRLKEFSTYCWAALDVLMLTGILWIARGVESPAIIFYPLLVAVTGLRYRIGLVWMVCGISIGCYWLLLLQSSWLQVNSTVPASQPIYYSLSLVMFALVMHLLLWRIQQISSVR